MSVTSSSQGDNFIPRPRNAGLSCHPTVFTVLYTPHSTRPVARNGVCGW